MIALEKHGVPTVFFCPESFRGIAEAQARLSGMPSYSPVTVPGPLVAVPPQQLIAMVDQAADRIVERLTRASSSTQIDRPVG